MRAQMNQRVDALDLAQPDVERDIGVARRQGEVVILALARLDAAAIGLHRDDHLPARTKRKTNAPSRTAGSVSGSPQAATTLRRKGSGSAAKRST